MPGLSLRATRVHASWQRGCWRKTRRKAPPLSMLESTPSACFVPFQRSYLGITLPCPSCLGRLRTLVPREVLSDACSAASAQETEAEKEGNPRDNLVPDHHPLPLDPLWRKGREKQTRKGKSCPREGGRSESWIEGRGRDR